MVRIALTAKVELSDNRPLLIYIELHLEKLYTLHTSFISPALLCSWRRFRVSTSIQITAFAGLLAVFISALLTPLVRKAAHAFDLVESPGDRDVHTAAIPRMGGIAIFIAFGTVLATLLASNAMTITEGGKDPFLGYVLGGSVIFVAGLYDDLKGLGAKKKLLAQLIAATLAWYGGAQIQNIVNVPGIGAVTLGPIVAYAATIVWILAFINAVNLIDGLDGLAGGLVFFAALTNLSIALITHNVFAAVTNAALAGSVLGFLFYNFNPARIFMGDTGSLFLGYALSAGALLSSRQKESTLASLLVLIIALGLPLTDTILSMVRRVLQRRSIFAADRGHVHHRLLALGLTHKKAVLVLYACTVFLCALSVAAAIGQDWQVGLALMAAITVLAGIIRFSGYFGRVITSETASSENLNGQARRLSDKVPEFVLESLGATNMSALFVTLENILNDSGILSASLAHENSSISSTLWMWKQANSQGRRTEGRMVTCTYSVQSPNEEGVKSFSISTRVPEGPVPNDLNLIVRLIAKILTNSLNRVDGAGLGGGLLSPEKDFRRS